MTGEKKNRRTLGQWFALVVFAAAGLLIIIVCGDRYVSLQPLRSKPFLYLVPQERVVWPAGVFPGTLFSAYGYSFQPPWVGVDSRIQTHNLADLEFQTGQTFQVHNPALGFDWRAKLDRPENSPVMDRLQAAFGRSCCDANYAIVKRILHTSPRQLRFLQSAKQSLAIGILLTYRSAYVGEDTAEDFAFRSRQVRGFQLGSPTRSKSVRLVVFPKDGSELWIDISNRAGRLQQQEIDLVIASFRRLSN